jgi:hypothetical protein
VRLARRLSIATIGVGLVAAATAATAMPSSPAAAAPARGVIRPVQHVTMNTTSGNWFGYNVNKLSRKKFFHQISGTWRVPTATQHTRGKPEYSSTWIGIGGGCVSANCAVVDNTLIQTGTEQDVAANGQASYHAWYELIPAPSIRTALVVRPGDLIRANINQVVEGVWRISLNNLTTAKSWSVTVPYSSTHLTAEWIEETPLILGTGAGFAALPNLSQAHFDNALLNGANPRLKAAERVFLAPDGTHVIGAPSLPQADGNGFGACTWATSCGIPANY